MSAHTKGPWAWQEMGGWRLVGQWGMRPIVLSAKARNGKGPGKFALRDDESDLLIPFDPNHPDARLIAAAPDLLEACRAWVDWMDSPGGGTDKTSDDEDKMIDAMRDAIAKAEGQEEKR